MTLRESNINDLEAINRLYEELYDYHVNKLKIKDITDDPTAYSKVEYTINLKSPVLRYYVVEKDDQIIGMTRCTLVGNSLNVNTLVVSMDFRGNGYGKELLKFAIDANKELVKEVRVNVYDKNKIAKKLYKKLGFKGAIISNKCSVLIKYINNEK